MRSSLLAAPCLLFVAVVLTGCTPKTSASSSSSSTGGGGGGGGGFDAGLVSGACLRDQECGAGNVCLGADAGCRPGVPCSSDGVCGECDVGGSLHCGFVGAAYCDTANNVCRRVLSSCEPCSTDAQCGENVQLGLPNRCLSYAGGGKFCGLACSANSCSEGFSCLNPAGTACAGGALDCACHVAPALGSCQGAVPCTVETDCPARTHCTTAASTTPRPGVCLAFCKQDSECPSGTICQTQAGPSFGLCIQGCVAGQAGANGTVCHSWGRAGPACPATACPMGYDCSTTNPGYCKLPGCQADAQCQLAGTICDTSSSMCVANKLPADSGATSPTP